MELSKKEIFELLKDNLNMNVDQVYQKVETFISVKYNNSFKLTDRMKQTLHNLLYAFRNKLKSKCVNRTKAKFYKKYNGWLCESVFFNDSTDAKSSQLSSGRPSSDFHSSSERSKRRKTEKIRTQLTTEELSYATQMSLRHSGQLDAAKVVKDVTSKSPTRASKYRKSIEKVSEKTLSKEAALSLFVEQKLTKSQYQGLRNISLENHCSLYPPYRVISEAKNECYPSKTDIIITESSAEVKLQALLNHTVTRILLTQGDVIKSLTPDNVNDLKLICKWGCDGSSGQSVYKQKFENTDREESKSDANIFFTSIVPLQLISLNEKTKQKIIIWKNPRSSSPRFCRPLRIQFIHETTEIAVKEKEYIEAQAEELVPFQTIIDGKEINVSFQLAFTMIDGKICNAITETSSTMRCYLCNATSSSFNKIDEMLQRNINEKHLSYGLSTLHAWIRCFECLLHLSYKLAVKKWQVRQEEEKQAVQERKKVIQKGFRMQLGLIVDQPKPGFGTSNDGNTARRFFEKYTTSSQITGVDVDLIKRFYIILQALSSEYEIDTAKFKTYALNLARKFVELYPWYCMPTSIHKILIHGDLVISSAILPIGQMSEDAQESTNKIIKRAREDFSRKSSRINTMTDVFLRLLVTSDPYISSIRKLPQKKLRLLLPEAMELLMSPTLPLYAHESDDDDNDSHDFEELDDE